MRGLPVRRTALTALCATLVLGIAAPTALAADGEATRERTHAVPSAPLTGADALLARARVLDEVQPALTPVTDLLDTSLRSGGDRIGADRARRLGAAAEEALTEVTKAAAPTGTPPSAGTRAQNRAADVTDDVLADVQKQVDALLAAISGDVGQILSSATSLVNGLTDMVTSLVDGLSLPALEDLLPELPALPTTPELPVETPELPVEAPALPATTPELPVTLPAVATELPLAPPAPVPAG
ncbi:hypothetical protein [Streptomyces sp. ID05-47C]|uniref:hypothetical protein n=1 Tax=Streptomyces sp. ID05-47C TaxID=3028665 RepID=UPI0029B84ADA|nr:hypothetical protein [Streptomyces sp. ID05-47C]MDX3569813.1 hypothetical protein [Streptomyces sp. ID05-47C]